MLYLLNTKQKKHEKKHIHNRKANDRKINNGEENGGRKKYSLV